jgi:hypothetical protein
VGGVDPIGEREVFVRAAKTGDKVIFERGDCSFGSISAVDVWRNELVVHVDAGVGGCRMLRCQFFGVVV